MNFLNKKFEAAIFDMDGTIFDTERLRFKMLKKASLELFGEEMSDQLLYDSLGVTAATGEKLAKELYGEHFPYKEIRKLADDLERQYIREHGVPIKDGLYNLLERLKKNQILIALATSSRREIATEYLIQAKVIRYFDVIVCGDEVENGKPDPEIFIKAANELSCAPENCLIMEDSKNGLLAALAANGNPIFIKDIKDVDEDIKEKVFKSYLKLTDFLEDIIPCTKRMGVPELNEGFPLNSGYEIAGIHGFGAIGGGYLAQIFSHWDGYTRPKKIIGATRNSVIRQIVNSIGKYRVKYESLAYFQTIDHIHLIDINDETELLEMYEKASIIGLSLPEKVISLQAPLIAKCLMNRYQKGYDNLTMLIVMNKLNAASFVKRHLLKALKEITTENEAKSIINRTYFCESVVNRMVAGNNIDSVISKLQNDLTMVHKNIFEYSADLKDLFDVSQYYLNEPQKTKKQRRKLFKATTNDTISISNNLSAVTKFAKNLSELNITLFSSEPDMPIYVSNESPLLSRLRQVVTVKDIKSMQEIKNKLSNGTHAIIAWYAKLLGYETIGQGMRDPRVEKIASKIMKNELKPALLTENPELKTYINSFIANFIKRCKESFKDKCIRVGRDPLRKLQNGERVIGAIQLAQKHHIKTDTLEFGVACAILYSLKITDVKDNEAETIREIYSKNHSISDVLTYSGLYNNSSYKGLYPIKDQDLISRIKLQFDALNKQLNILSKENKVINI